jgi:phosphosulfolactate synthase (CoM biosynthesis protein A)
VSLSAQFATYLNGVTNALNGVVCVHQKNAVIRHCAGVGLKCFELVFEKHDPTVGLRPAHGDAELLSCLQIRCAGTAADVSGTGCCQSTIDSLRSAETKLDYGIMLSSQADTRRLSRDQALEIENIEESRFEELTFNDRTNNSNQRFVRKNQGSFRNCIYVAGQLQPAQVIKKTRIEQRFTIIAALRAKIIDLRISEVERAQEVGRCRQSASHGELPVKGVLPKRRVEYRLIIGHSCFEITARHRDLVEVGRKGGEAVPWQIHTLTGNLDVSRPFATETAARASGCVPYLRTMETKGERSFSFLRVNQRKAKPRTRGLTEIRGPYYSVVGRRYLEDLFELMGEYVDSLKFAGGSFALMPETAVRSIIELCHHHNVLVSTGGFLEHVLAQGSDAVRQYVAECERLGFDIIEISAGFISISTDDWLRLIELVRKSGLKAKPEVGIQFGAGGATAAAELQAEGTRDPDWAIAQAKRFLEAGADIIMIESEGITENVDPWRTDVPAKFINEIGMDKLMFEAADPDVFAWYIKNYGADVNLFVDHSQIVQLECLRAGIWGTKSLWGRVMTYKDTVQ